MIGELQDSRTHREGKVYGYPIYKKLFLYEITRMHKKICVQGCLYNIICNLKNTRNKSNVQQKRIS